MGNLFFYGLCLWLTYSPATAQTAYQWTPGLRNTYSDLQKLKNVPVPTDEPGQSQAIRIFLADYADMLTLVTTDNETLFKQLTSRQDERLEAIEKMDAQSPWQRLLLAEIRLHWAFIKFKFGREMSASWDVIRAYKLLAENRHLFPAFAPTYKSLGTLYVMIGSVPEAYTWVANLLGLRGGVEQGLQLLKRTRNDVIFGLETRIIEILINAYVLRYTEKDAQQLAQQIAQHPDNLLLYFLGATIEQKQNNSAKAMNYLLKRPTGADYRPMPIIDNLLGDYYLQSGDYEQATTYFQHFLRTYKGQNFLKDTYYKLAIGQWLAGKPEPQWRPLLARVRLVGRTSVEADKAAQQFAETYAQQPLSNQQAVLMRARLATDGGYLSEAVTYLKPYTEASFASLPDKAEFNYRLGRIFQKANQPDAAIPYLVRAISLSDAYTSRPLSFGASAALQLGYIYQQKNDRTRARSFFQKALSSGKHAYKNSVDNKARAALSQLQSG